MYAAQKIFITTALGGWSVGVKPGGDGKVEVWFSRLLLGHLDPATASFRAVRTDGPEAGPNQNQK
jgi:hypothetical protein